MKIIVIGGTGLIGSKLVSRLRDAAHEAIAASPNTGVNSVTGEGLAKALTGAQILVDVSNSPSFEDEAVMAFFRASTGHLLEAARNAGVRHYVALSVVGTERMQGSGYFRAKLAQEQLIADSGLPYSIVRATQFFEFIGAIADSSMQGDVAHLSPATLQPMAGDDVAAALADIALSAPANALIEIGGPERLPLADFVMTWLSDKGDRRAKRVDPAAPYFGMAINDGSLTPSAGARLQPTHYADWLARAKMEA
jgi:uncharacterized protein YbjT (DUF2867 family)